MEITVKHTKMTAEIYHEITLINVQYKTQFEIETGTGKSRKHKRDSKNWKISQELTQK